MAKIQGFILYKIYYQNDLVYLGRTKQPLVDRIRGHVFKKNMLREIDINLVTKIEYAELKTEADMFLYEIYYINILKPPLNKDDKAKDGVTVVLPDVHFKEFTTPLWEGWKEIIADRNAVYHQRRNRFFKIQDEITDLRRLRRIGEISHDEYELKYYDLVEEKKDLKELLYS